VTALLEQLAQDEADARAAFAAGAAGSAAGLLVAIAIEYADFRGLPQALAAFQAAPGSGLLPDLARLTLPCLDGSLPFDAASDAAAHRVHAALREARLAPDVQMLALKLLIDHRGHQLDRAGTESLFALGHELAAQPGVSPIWQGRWWLLALQHCEWYGDAAGTAQALAQANKLVQRHALPRLRFELACIEMSAALKAEELPLADRLFREIDALRPAVRRGRLPHGLRAQALYLARRGDFEAALQRIKLLLALCADMAVPRRDIGPYQVLHADCLLALGHHAEALALMREQFADQQAVQRELFEARVAVHRAAACIDQPGEAADALCRDALQACARLRYTRFLRPLPELAARLVARGLRLGVAPEFLRDVVHERRLRPQDATRPDWPWRLHVHAFGPLRLLRDGLPLAGAAAKAQRKPLELLRLLAAHGGGPLAVSLVIDALWPSLDAEAPRASFEMAVSRLRKLLDLPEAVRVADDAVSLDPALVWIDTAAFEQLAHRTGDAAQGLALALYTAPLFGQEPLEGLLHMARERLALLHQSLAQTECDRLLADGHSGAALRAVQQALAHDPLNEPLHRTLMRAHLQLGERAEALRSYHRLCDLLRRQLAIEPAPQTVQLAREAGG
jgi:DNA-binding SARP family transcriptional activator